MIITCFIEKQVLLLDTDYDEKTQDMLSCWNSTREILMFMSQDFFPTKTSINKEGKEAQ